MSKQHLSKAEIEAYTFKGLAGAEKERVHAHLATCPECHQIHANIGMAAAMREMEEMAAYNEQNALEDDPFWGPPYPFEFADAPPTRDEINAWEQMNGLPLPASLADALTRQNGGYLHGKETVICPLKEFQLLTAAKWDDSFQFDQIVSQRDKLVYIGFESEGPGLIILDYSKGAEPAVLHMWRDLGDELRPAADSFDALRE